MKILPLLTALWLLIGALHAAGARWALREPSVNADATLDGRPVRLVDPAIVRERDRRHVFAPANPAGFAFHGARRGNAGAPAKETPCIHLLERIP